MKKCLLCKQENVKNPNYDYCANCWFTKIKNKSQMHKGLLGSSNGLDLKNPIYIILIILVIIAGIFFIIKLIQAVIPILVIIAIIYLMLGKNKHKKWF